MTVSSLTNRMDYTGNGATDTYPYTFRIFDDSDLIVTRRNTANVETELILNSGGADGYTVTGADEPSGGNVVLTADLASGYTLTIRRRLDLLQGTDLRNQGAYNAEDVERQLDRLTMADQQQQDEIDRSVKLPETVSPADVSTALPVPEGDKMIGWNEAGDALVNLDPSEFVSALERGNYIVDRYVAGVGFTAGVTTQLVLSEAPGTENNTQITFDGVLQHKSTYSVSSAVVTFSSAIPVGVAEIEIMHAGSLTISAPADGSVTMAKHATMAARTVIANDTASETTPSARSIDDLTLASDIGGSRHDLSARAAWRVNVKDFGATGDGTTDDTAAVQLAITTLLATTNGPGRLYFPKGTYRVSTLAFSLANASITLTGEGVDCSIIKKTGASTDPVLNFSSSGNNKQILVENLEVDANSVANCDAILLNRVAYVTIRDVRAWNARRAISGVGCLLSTVDRVTARNSQTGFLFRYDAGSTTYANVIALNDCVIQGNSSWGVDYGEGSGLAMRGCDIETNGTAADTSTGGVVIRSTIDDEFGFGIVSMNDCWFENNLGRSISLEGATGGSVSIRDTIVANPESDRALYCAAGLRLLSLESFFAVGTNDTADVSADNFFAKNCYIYTLTNNATNYSLHNVKTATLDALTTIKTATAGSDINIGTSGVTAKNCPKAIAKFDGTAVSPTAVFNYNINSITKNGTGDYTVQYGSTLTGNAVVATAFKVGGSSLVCRYVASSSSTYRFQVRDNSDTLTDADEITVVVYGT